MVSTDFYSITASRIANFYKINGAELSKNLLRIAAQKRFAGPSDNIPDYIRSQKIQRENKDYKGIQTELQVALAMMDVAEHAAMYVQEDLSRMKELVGEYYDAATTADEQAAIEDEFDQLKNSVTDFIGNTYYDDKLLIQDTSLTQPLRSVLLNPYDMSQTFDIEFDDGDVPAVAALDVTAGQVVASAAVQDELDKVNSYLAKTSGYIFGLNSQYNMAANKVVNNKAADSAISDVDGAKELLEVTKRSLRQQSSAAMLSQLNISRQNVLMLIMWWK
jgi:flagellin